MIRSSLAASSNCLLFSSQLLVIRFTVALLLKTLINVTAVRPCLHLSIFVLAWPQWWLVQNWNGCLFSFALQWTLNHTSAMHQPWYWASLLIILCVLWKAKAALTLLMVYSSATSTSPFMHCVVSALFSNLLSLLCNYFLAKRASIQTVTNLITRWASRWLFVNNSLCLSDLALKVYHVRIKGMKSNVCDLGSIAVNWLLNYESWASFTSVAIFSAPTVKPDKYCLF